MILFSSRVWNLDLGVCERFPFDALCRSPWPLIYPCSFFLWNSLKANSQTDSLMAKKEVLTHTHDAIASRQQYIDLSAKSAVLYQSKKSRFINTRLIKMDSWGLLLLSSNGLCAWPSAALASKVSCRLVSNGEKLCLLITLTADFPCNFALTFPLSAKKGVDKHASP